MNLNFTIKKCIVIAFAFVLSVNLTTVMAQTSSVIKPTEEQATLMKALKKEHKLKSITLIYDSYASDYYFLLKKKGTNKQLLHGIASVMGDIIIPIEYTNIKIYTGSQSTISYEHCILTTAIGGDVKREEKTMPFKDNSSYPLHFLCSKHNSKSIISTSGKILKDNIEGYVDRFHGFWLYSNYKDKFLLQHMIQNNTGDGSDRIAFHNPQLLGLLSQKGEPILDPIYDFIMIKKYHISDDIVTACIYRKIENDACFYGGCSIDDLTDSIPAIFKDIAFSLNGDGKWMVKRSRFENFVAYDLDMNTKQGIYRDKGEEYFEGNYYQKVIDFYEDKRKDVPWANFYTGLANYNLCTSIMTKVDSDIKRIENSTNDSEVEALIKNEPFTVSDALEFNLLSHINLKSYCDSDYKNDNFKVIATTILQESDKIGKNIIPTGVKYLEVVESYENRTNAYIKHQAQIKKQRNAAIALAILGAATSVATSAIENSSKTATSNSYSSGSNTTSLGSSNNSSSSSESKGSPNPSHVNKLKKDIENAQERYQNSIERGDPAATRSVYKNALDKYNKILEDYMNSFK